MAASRFVEPLVSSRFRRSGRACVLLDETQRGLRDDLVAKLADGRYAQRLAPCPICGPGELEGSAELAEQDRCGVPMATRVCRSCGLVQTSPRMDAAAYRAFYNGEYRRLYYGRGEGAAASFRRERRRGRGLLRFLRGHGVGVAGAFVVDVGCGSGGVLAVLRDAGAEVMGLDVDEGMLAYGRRQGLTLEVGALAEVSLPRAPQLVIYSHVFEHLLEPLAELRQLRRLLAPQGRLLVEVPGIKNLGVYDHDLLRYLQVAHVYQFSLRTLVALMRRGGFVLRQGDEGITALFELEGAASATMMGASDYQPVLAYLRAAEERHARPLLGVKVKSQARVFLARSGLFPLFRALRRYLR